ncbi:primosomal protein N' [Marinobacterium arenosum]|uniref:primosomal protein N' n=1 Tax=Marinobacterium arenosum TaxID=2862496 RepID=UPI001C96FC50|nr:primosomal protein N' [Marinobacterium arenosum]MBY4678080.1 primosomal protein N' [Marinobacterium arenosum]
MSVLRLAIPSPVRRLFDYLPPAGVDATVLQPGVRVRVPFGPRQLIGMLISVEPHSDLPRDKLKPALEILDPTPPLPAHLLKLARWAASYYQHPVGDALLQALPVLLRKGAPCEYAHEHLWRATADASLDALGKAARRQRELLQLLQEHPQGISSDAIRAEGGNTQLLKTLLDKGLAESFVHHPPSRHAGGKDSLLRQPSLPLNDQQRQAVEAINGADGFQPFLLEGVTGSGKTEVYLQTIEAVLQQGRQALVLVPEIGLTPQTVARFKQRFQVPVVVLHSNLTDRQRLDAWLKVREGLASIVIGTRSALFTPLQAPGIIIVDEEHDASFKQQDGFRYSARDLSVMRAREEDVPLVLGSATPSLESLWNAEQGRYRHLQLTERAGNARPPKFELLDIRQQPIRDGLAEPMIEQIRQHLGAGNQVLVFLNRRGYSPTLSCHNCGWIADCSRCDAHMTLHLSPPHLHCHHCDSQRPIPAQCPDCGSPQLKPVGSGTERSEQILRQLFSDYPVLRVDRDSTARKDALAQIMAQVHSGEPCILVGTQMLAKGHHFPNVTLVAILNADGGLFSADFRGMERTAQLLVQVAGRAGRAERPGHVLMQTMHADHPAIQCLVDQGYSAFARSELHDRHRAALPPFMHLALLKAEASRQGRAEAFLRAVRDLLERGGLPPAVDLVGPFPSTMEKKAGVFRAQLLIQSPQRGVLQQWLGMLCEFLEQQPEARKVRWTLDVDPLEMN